MAPPPELWRIYHVPNCSHTRPKPKPKYVVIVCRGVMPMGFLINSEINVWIRINSDLMACQAPIIAVEHPGCLHYDGFVDCLDLYPFEDFELTDVRDEVSSNAKKAILAAVRNSKGIPQGLKRTIVDS